MLRKAVGVLTVVALVSFGWALGRAQTRVQLTPNGKPAPPEIAGTSDFEIQVFSISGQVEVRCVRGCKLAYSAFSGPPELRDGAFYGGSHPAAGSVMGAWTADRCMAAPYDTGGGNCHILGWKQVK
jgi:hypothetical protein